MRYSSDVYKKESARDYDVVSVENIDTNRDSFKKFLTGHENNWLIAEFLFCFLQLCEKQMSKKTLIWIGIVLLNYQESLEKKFEYQGKYDVMMLMDCPFGA